MKTFTCPDAVKNEADRLHREDPAHFYIPVTLTYDHSRRRGTYAIQIIDPTADLSGPQESWPESVFVEA